MTEELDSVFLLFPADMGIAFRDSHGAVAEKLFDPDKVHSLLNQPAGNGMSQIMKTQSDNIGFATRRLERLVGFAVRLFGFRVQEHLLVIDTLWPIPNAAGDPLLENS